MNIDARVKEITKSMKSFNKESYRKNEILPELFSLQQELVALTFNEEHAELSELRIWDVENHLEQLNKDCGRVATDELRQFEAGCKNICNLIKSEISGNRGEYKAFCVLENLRTPHCIVKNVELSNGIESSELDAVVITNKGIFIVEVKNTARNIYISENGNYYRNGEFQKLDCCISSKIETKERLLRSVLQHTEYSHIPVYSVLVFTNNQIEIQNKCANISSCFLDQLRVFIDEYEGAEILRIDEMNAIASAIEEAKRDLSFPLEIDITKFKEDFATVMAMLEAASSGECFEEEKEVTQELIKENDQTNQNPYKDKEKIKVSSKYRRFGEIAAVAAITIIATAISMKRTA